MDLNFDWISDKYITCCVPPFPIISHFPLFREHENVSCICTRWDLKAKAHIFAVSSYCVQQRTHKYIDTQLPRYTHSFGICRLFFCFFILGWHWNVASSQYSEIFTLAITAANPITSSYSPWCQGAAVISVMRTVYAQDSRGVVFLFFSLDKTNKLLNYKNTISKEIVVCSLLKIKCLELGILEMHSSVKWTSAVVLWWLLGCYVLYVVLGYGCWVF